MKLSLEAAGSSQTERRTELFIDARELHRIHLHIAHAEERNETDRYMRRHRINNDPSDTAEPDNPQRSPEEPAKLTIPEHIEIMRQSKTIPRPQRAQSSAGETYFTERSMIAVSIGDLAANLLRPCYHRNGLGRRRLFYFDAEPIERRNYFCACYFQNALGNALFDMRRIRFDQVADLAFDLNRVNLLDDGLIWAAALVPLVEDGHALTNLDIALHDYDLRHILGRSAITDIRYVYDGWYDKWETRLAEVLARRNHSQRSDARFYHSILGIDGSGCIHIIQEEGTLPDLAGMLERRGIVNAGVLDSGGSCALYDVWLESYLNHGWYFREPRGSILVFELSTEQRIPRTELGSWSNRRKVQA